MDARRESAGTWAARLTVMLYRLALVAMVAHFVVMVAGPAHADPTASTEGTVAAWDKTQTRVIAVRACTRSRKGDGYDYRACERWVRVLVTTRLCARAGRGKQTFYLQVADGTRTKASVRCD